MYQSKQLGIFLGSIRSRIFTSSVATDPSSTEQTTHRLDAELISMRIDELVSSPAFAGDLASRHAGLPRLSLTGSSSVEEILGTPGLWLAVLTDTVATALAILTALRLLRVKGAGKAPSSDHGSA